MSNAWPKDEDELKRDYARILHERPRIANAEFTAAQLMFPLQRDTGLALHISTHWPTDPVVIAELDNLKTTDAQGLPDKDQVAREIYSLATNDKLKISERLAAYELYSKIKGQIDRPGGGVNVHVGNNSVDNRRVYMIPTPQPIEEWDAMAKSQQAGLLADASNDRD